MKGSVQNISILSVDYHQSTRKSKWHQFDFFFVHVFSSFLFQVAVFECENLYVIRTTRKPSIIGYRDVHKSIVEAKFHLNYFNIIRPLKWKAIDKNDRKLLCFQPITNQYPKPHTMKFIKTIALRFFPTKLKIKQTHNRKIQPKR